jgi:hypothetical protein
VKPFIGFEIKRFKAATSDKYCSGGAYSCGCTYSYTIDSSGALHIFAEWPKKKGRIIVERERETELLCVYSASAWSQIVPIYDDKESRQAA